MDDPAGITISQSTRISYSILVVTKNTKYILQEPHWSVNDSPTVKTVPKNVVSR